jgi:hypothetical protein
MPIETITGITSPAPRKARVSTATFAGFNAKEISEYFGGLDLDTSAALIAAANGTKLSDDQRTLLGGLGPKQLGPATGSGSSGNITWGLQHLAEHPKGSHYSGDFNVGDIAKNIGLNFATAGYYGVAKAGEKAISTGKIGAAGFDALANVGLAGSVLQPTVGTKKSLLLQAAIGGGAVAAGPAAGAAGGTGVGVSSGVAGTGAEAATGGSALGISGSQLATGASLAASGASIAAPLLTKTPKLPVFDPAGDKARADRAALNASNAVQSKEAEARRQRRAKSVQSVLTGGGGASGFAPVQTPTLQAGQPRKSVLG